MRDSLDLRQVARDILRCREESSELYGVLIIPRLVEGKLVISGTLGTMGQ